MTNRKTTRRALVLSLLSLLLCCSMLVGTTFAWFTDSVQSGNNKIVAGNLDVELYHSDKAVDNEKVTTATKLFDDIKLWEPGVVAWENLTVSNEGTLALKYQLSVNFTNATKTPAGKTLADVLKVAFVKGGVDGTQTREQMVGNITTWGELKSFKQDGKLLPKNSTLTMDDAPKGSATYGIVIWWEPGATDNDFNMNNGNKGVELSIDLGVTLVATQLEAEDDSFGTNYDKDATYPIISSISVPANTTAPTPVTAKEVTVEIPAGAAAGNYTLEVANKQVATDAAGKTTVTFDINLLKDGVKVAADGSTKYAVEIEVGKNLDVSAVTHNGVAVSSFFYDPAVGVVSFETDSFSPFAVIYTEADGDSVFVPEDPEAAEKLEKEEVVAVDENGNEYTSLTAAINSGASKLYFKEGADLGDVTHLDVVGDLTIYGNGAFISGGERDFAIDIYAPLTDDVTITVYNLHGVAFWGSRTTDKKVTLNLYNCDDLGRIYLAGTSGVNNINLVGCTADKATLVGDTVVYSNANGKIVIDGCTFNNVECPVNLNHKIAGEQTVIVKNSTFVDCATEGTAAYYAPIRLYNSADGANQTVTVSGNTFTYSDGKAPVNGADVLLNAKHNGVDATGTIKADVQANAAVSCGVNVEFAYTIANAQELAHFAAEVNKGAEYEGNTYEGKTVVLTADINLGGAEWTPIGNFGITSKQFKGVFDGQGHMVSNFQITQKSPDREGQNRSPEGFFGNVNGTIKNLTIANATVKVTNDGRFVGGIIGRLNGGLVENCKLVASHVEGSAWQIGGIVGQVNSGTIENCIVENTTVAGKAGVGAVAGFQMEAKETTINKCSVKNCEIKQNGSYGEGYDDMFAAVLGCVNNSEATVNINGCIVENTTVKGTTSSVLCGYIEEGAKVYIDGFEVIADGLTKKGVEYNVSNANGLETLHGMMVDKTAGRDAVVNLLADIDYTGKTWTSVDSHADTAFEIAEINGNGHTISNLTVNGQAMFRRFAGSGDVVIKDITFDNATINSNGTINTSILTVQSYQNVLLDNVDVTNSTITGGYKVAPLIATVYNESSSTVTATLKNCDVFNTTVKATSYDFCTTGMVAFVNAGDNDKVVFENCTVTDVKLIAPDDTYKAHAAIYTTGSGSLYNEAEGVTVSNVTFANN